MLLTASDSYSCCSGLPHGAHSLCTLTACTLWVYTYALFRSPRDQPLPIGGHHHTYIHVQLWSTREVCTPPDNIPMVAHEASMCVQSPSANRLRLLTHEAPRLLIPTHDPDEQRILLTMNGCSALLCPEVIEIPNRTMLPTYLPTDEVKQQQFPPNGDVQLTRWTAQSGSQIFFVDQIWNQIAHRHRQSKWSTTLLYTLYSSSTNAYETNGWHLA